MEISIEVWVCKGCGRYALGIAGKRASKLECDCNLGWKAIPRYCFRVDVGHLIANAADKESRAAFDGEYYIEYVSEDVVHLRRCR